MRKLITRIQGNTTVMTLLSVLAVAGGYVLLTKVVLPALGAPC